MLVLLVFMPAGQTEVRLSHASGVAPPPLPPEIEEEVEELRELKDAPVPASPGRSRTESPAPEEAGVETLTAD